ncbi:MAG TPA: ribonuclease P protein component [Verrucomicrobiales bacterium]|nr:ribonuclease P protein component [Verrucomicrobiales bacterium]
MPAEPKGSLGLPASRRIKQSREFARIKSGGRRLTLGCLILNWSLGPEPRPPRLGVIVSRKVGCAVVRNRAKRLLRESFRLNQARLPASLRLVLVARASIASKDFVQVERDFMTALRQARLLTEPTQA